MLLVVYPEESSGQHQIRTVPATLGSFDSRMDLRVGMGDLREGRLAGAIRRARRGVLPLEPVHRGSAQLEGLAKMAQMALK